MDAEWRTGVQLSGRTGYEKDDCVSGEKMGGRWGYVSEWGSE